MQIHKLKKSKGAVRGKKPAVPKFAATPRHRPVAIKPSRAAVPAGSIIERLDHTLQGDSVGAHHASFIEAAAIVKAGLPLGALTRLQRTSGLTAERIKHFAGISEGSFARRKITGLLGFLPERCLWEPCLPKLLVALPAEGSFGEGDMSPL